MNRFQEFMQGRYGYDKLGLFIIIASIVISMIGRLFFLPWVSPICFVLDIIFIYRFLSRKEYARSRENRIFLELFDRAKDFFSRDRQNYNYYTCPVCKTKFRTPKNRAQGYTSRRICPKCKNEW